MTTERFFEEVELPDLQKSDNGVVFPAVLFPNPKINDSCQLSHLNKAIEAHKPWLESLLHKTGALLLRGFPVTTASEFNDVVEAFDFPDMPYMGGGAVRSQVVGRVYTANESPPDQRIHFHNEMAYASDFPNKLFFFCEVEPRSGGETAIVQGHVLYDRMKEKYPEFVQELEEHGLIYARLMPEEDDNSHQIGRGWKSTFSTSDKSVAEQRASKLGMKMEWLENVLILKSEPRLAIKFDQVKQRKTWFNSLGVVYESSKGVKNVNVDKLIMFGNGKSLPDAIVHDCLKIMDEESVAIPWEKGDILLIDNLTVLHSRLPLISPPRRVLVSICK